MPVLGRHVKPRGGLLGLKTTTKGVSCAENESQRGWRGKNGLKMGENGPDTDKIG